MIVPPPAALDAAGLQSLLTRVAALDLREPEAARAALERDFPHDGPYARGVFALLEAGVVAGTVCHRGAPPVRWSRVFKAAPESAGLAADAVLMTAPGPRHRHPNGEVDLCFAIDGAPTFDGHPPGWTVYPPGSEHVPTVAGGTMLILYLLPGGAIEFAA